MFAGALLEQDESGTCKNFDPKKKYKISSKHGLLTAKLGFRSRTLNQVNVKQSTLINTVKSN